MQRMVLKMGDVADGRGKIWGTLWQEMGGQLLVWTADQTDWR
jgi:hypothetical protein